jgi:hypothetical protein
MYVCIYTYVYALYLLYILILNVYIYIYTCLNHKYKANTVQFSAAVYLLLFVT